MATLPGRCVNEMFCSFAASGQIIRVPAEARFVCPQCGKALVPPNTPFRSQRRRGSGIGPLSIVMIIVGFIAGMVLGGAWVWPVHTAVVVPVTTTRLPPPPPTASVPQLQAPAPITTAPIKPRRRRARTPDSAGQDARPDPRQ